MKNLRFDVYPATIDQFKEQRLGTTPGLYQGSPAHLDFAVRDEDGALIDIASLYTDLTLEIWTDQDTGGRLFQKVVAAAEFDATCTLADWTDGTKQPVRFTCTGDELNLSIAAGRTSQTFYMVLGGSPVDGEPETLGQATLKLVKDRFGEPGDAVENDPAAYYSAAQADARFVRFSGGAGYKFENGYLQIRDAVTGNWRGLFANAGEIAVTAESPGPAEGGDFYRFAGNYLQLKDAVTGGWRSLILDNGEPAVGAEEIL